LSPCRSVVLLLRDVGKGVQFYGDEGLGLVLKHSTDTIAEFDTGGTPLVLKSAVSEAVCSVGYSPLLCFDVPDMHHAIQRAIKLGAHLDGPIKYPAHGAVASIRSPDGHMIGLFQPDDSKE
ncbi:unnamed protein product, partial [Choristocarpus tenellus]